MKANVKITVSILATIALLPCLASGQSLLSEHAVSLNAASRWPPPAWIAAAPTVTRGDDNGAETGNARTALVLSGRTARARTPSRNSMRKAYTAFTTRAPSGEMSKRPGAVAQRLLAAGQAHRPRGWAAPFWPAKSWLDQSASPALPAATRMRHAPRWVSTRSLRNGRVTAGLGQRLPCVHSD